MIANSEDRGTLARAMGRLTIGVGLAATAGIILTATAPVRLVGVTSQGETVLIEATEPVAYSVSRPDALSLVVDLRNVSVSDARADVERQGAIAGVRLEQASAADGRALARVHVALAKPSEYVVRSARNTIRVELKQAAPGASAAPLRSAPVAASRQTPAPAAPVLVPVAAVQPQTPAPAKTTLESIEKSGKPEGPQSATIIERIKSSRTPGATTVTLVGNGHLAPAGVTESKDRPRRLVLDFPNVASKAPTQTAIDSPFVTRVRVAVNSHQPLVTRVVMEIAGTASYHVERGGDGGRDLAVVFEQAKATNTVTLTPEEVSGKPIEPEPPITMQQALANAAAITRPEPAGELLDPMLALRAAAVTPPAVERAAPTAARASAPPAARQTTPPARRCSAAGTNGDRAGDRCADIGCCDRLRKRVKFPDSRPARRPRRPRRSRSHSRRRPRVEPMRSRVEPIPAAVSSRGSTPAIR